MYALYLRQSQDVTGQGAAVGRQRTECLAYAKAHGITVGAEYTDNDRSASRGVRPAYQRLLTDIESGRVTGVLAWALDRLHRQPRELEAFIDLADNRHIRLATVTGECDLATVGGRLYARVLGAVARNEQDQKADRIMAANRQLAAKGDLQPKERPFGWRRTFQGSRPVFNELDPVEAPAIRAAVDVLLSGGSALSVYKSWNARGLLTSKGNKWDNDKFRKVLLRERNAGLQTYNGVTRRASCTSIITLDELSELRAITASRIRQTHGERKSGFSGVPRCVCGHRMYLRNGPKASYCCNNAESLSHNCVSARVLDQAMWHALRWRIAERTPEAAVNEVLDQISAVRARLAELDAQDAEVMARKVTVKARLGFLEESKIERDQLETQLAFLASRSRLATLLDGVTPNPPGHRVSLDRHAEVGTRLEQLPVYDLYDLAEAMLSVVVHPLPGPRRGRMSNADILRRIQINGTRLGDAEEDVDPRWDN